MAANVVERASQLREIVDSLARAHDETGVLSIAVGMEPGAPVGGRPAWEIELKNDLARLSDDPATGRAVRQRLADATVQLEELVDPALSGRGRALYVELGSGASTEVFLHEPLPTGARVGPVAHLLPLLHALDEGAPAAFLVTSRDQIAIAESELGAVRDVERLELEPWVGDWWPEMKGAARANPLRGQQTVSHRDRYERRLAAAYRHTLDEAAARIGALAGERGWTRGVVAGDARQADALAEVLRRNGVDTTVVTATLEGARREEAVARLRNALSEMTAAQALRRTSEAKAEAAAGGKGACGLAPVLAALGEGRAARLLLDASRAYLGAVGEGDVLTAEPEPGRETDLTDRIVVQALATDAEVTPVSGEAAAALETCGGIGALLRW